MAEEKNTPKIEESEAKAAGTKAAAGDKPAAKATVKKPAVKKPAAKTPAAVSKPAVKKPAAKKPAVAVSKPAAKKPAAKPAKAGPSESAVSAEVVTGASAAAKPAAKKAPVKAAAKPAAKSATTEKKKAAPAPKAAKPAAKPAAKKAPVKAAAKPAPKAAKPAAKEAGPVVRKAPDARTASVVDAEGAKVDEIKLSAARFGLRPDVNLLHLAVRVEQAAKRSGTASSKSRGEVSGSTAKLYRQKGTGRARVGSVKSPTRVGGGVAFGPKPRTYDLKINRKAARRALDMALSDRAEGDAIVVARGLELDTPSTQAVDTLLVNLDLPVPVLVLTDDEPVVAKSARNLWYAETTDVRSLTTEQVLRARSLVVTEKAFSVLAGA